MDKEIVFLSKTMVIFITMMVMLVVPATAEETESTCDCIGTGTPGYWMNHPDSWYCTLEIGGTTYNKETMIMVMKMPVKGDKTYTMFPALVAAKLNVMVGNDHCCIDDTIREADLWMANHPLNSYVTGNSCAWQEGECLYEQLDLYNNGELCAPSRDVVEE